MEIDVLTLFPEVVDVLNSYGVIGRAIEKEIFSLNSINIRDFSKEKHRKVDDELYGRGCGMLMTPQPLHDAIPWVSLSWSRSLTTTR